MNDATIQHGRKLFFAEGNRLVCKGAAGDLIFDKIITKGTIKTLLLSPDNQGLLVLVSFPDVKSRLHLDISGSDLLNALFKLDFDGKLMWYAETHSSLSQYWEVYVKDNKIIAYDIEGYDCQIDPKTGKIISNEFVK